MSENKCAPMWEYCEGRKNKTQIIKPRNRGWLKTLLLSYFTFGIYAFFFTHYLIKDINTIAEDYGIKGVPKPWKLLVFTPLTLGLYFFYWLYQLGRGIDDACIKVAYNSEKRCQRLSPLLWNTVGLLLCGYGAIVSLHLVCVTVDTMVYLYNEETKRYFMQQQREAYAHLL